jgi:hypothetical protein
MHYVKSVKCYNVRWCKG